MKCAVIPVFTLSCVLLLGGTAAGEQLDVPGDYDSIQAAINAASDGDMILVEAGVYNERLDLLGKAITLHASSGAEQTVIDGQGGGSVVVCESGESNATVIDGFTIRGGTGTNIGLPNGGMAGGGMLIRASSPTVQNCIFESNAARHGAGLGNFDGATPIIFNCIFRNNHASGSPNGYGGRNRKLPRLGCRHQ